MIASIDDGCYEEWYLGGCSNESCYTEVNFCECGEESYRITMFCEKGDCEEKCDIKVDGEKDTNDLAMKEAFRDAFTNVSRKEERKLGGRRLNLKDAGVEAILNYRR